MIKVAGLTFVYCSGEKLVKAQNHKAFFAFTTNNLTAFAKRSIT